MIKILDRYIGKTIIKATVLIAVIISAVLLLINLMAEMKAIGEGDYGLLQAFMFVLMRLPNDLYQFFPMLMLLGSLVGLSILSSNKELTVMRAAGFSLKKIMRSVFLAASILIIVVSLLGELVGPQWSHRAEVNKERAQNSGQAVITSSGMWMHVNNNFIHVNHVINRKRLEGVTRYQFDTGNRLIAAYRAKVLAFDEGQWVMYDGVKTNFYPKQTQSSQFEKLKWNLSFNSNLLNIGLIEASEMTLPKLFNFIQYLEKNGLQANEYKHEFWQRLLQPLACLIMIFLALPFVLGANIRFSLGWRVLLGIMVGFGFFILNAFLAQITIVFQLPAIIAALLPLIIFFMIGVGLMRGMLRH